jgi:opacity protein-like surface antigen
MGGRIACCVAVLCVAASSAGAQTAGFYSTISPDLSVTPVTQPNPADAPTLRSQMDTEATGYDFGGIRTELETRSIGASEPIAGGIVLNGIYAVPTGQPLKPFVGAGIGAIKMTQRIPGAETVQWTDAVQVRGGLTYDITRAVRGLLEYRWQAGTPFAGSSTKLQFKQKGVVVGLKYTLQ